MSRLTAALFLCALTSCVGMEEEVRVERGPLLRSFDRQSTVDTRSIYATVQSRWPDVELHLQRMQTCRTEKVDEYAEAHVTERSSRGMGPAIALGISATLVGATLIASRNSFPSDPNRGVIDVSGHYGPSSRQVATGWGVAGLVLGVPAISVGIIDAVMTGESVENTKSEVITSAMDTPCKPEPLDGEVQFLTGSGAPVSLATRDGTVTLNAELLRKTADFSFNVGDQPVTLTPEDEKKLIAHQQCLSLVDVKEDTLLALSSERLYQERQELEESCVPLAPEPAKAALARFDTAVRADAVQHRSTGTLIGPQLQSFEDAVELLGPKRKVATGTADAVALSRNEVAANEALVVTGRVKTRTFAQFALVDEAAGVVLVLIDHPREEQNGLSGVRERRSFEIVVLEVGDDEVAVITSPGAGWDELLTVGKTVEVIGFNRSAQMQSGSPFPLVEAVYARASP